MYFEETLMDSPNGLSYDLLTMHAPRAGGSDREPVK
jgi:hypothetical protein